MNDIDFLRDLAERLADGRTATLNHAERLYEISGRMAEETARVAAPRKNQFVTYKTINGAAFSAFVKTVHRDGTCTIVTRHELVNGHPVGPLLGRVLNVDTYRLSALRVAGSK